MAAEDGSAPIPELIHLGERLSRARREQGLSLEDLAGRLRLGTEQLMALEAGDHANLPEAVFVVAQAKRVAGALRIDVSQQISDLQDSRMMRKVRRPPSAPVQRRIPNPPASPPAGRSHTRSAGPIGWLLLLGGGALAVAALQGKLPTIQAWRLPTPFPAPGAATAPVPPPAAPSAPSPASPVATAPPDQLLLRSAEPSWLEVRDSAGVTLFRGTFNGEKSFPLGSGLRVLAGRPDLVTASTGGQAARPLGRIDQVAWRTFKGTSASP
ncbi:helix-turn-helix domain-containing protein [Synechococcus sp. CCY 9618]|uniref:helix-turn-helix domain-containing protein n=1 Tax=Synechococcus sp. CCY 9618 TaxID=2815602 RepID=UPI001C21C99E|nr:helix-turn-helix domain-containing protein [Synechococcus sp. CCY 9618]